jgi:2,3-bisphosphoglycerate-dependent phosphoglycerate mutase
MSRLLLVRHAQSENNYHKDVIRKQFRDDPARARIESQRVLVADPELSEIGRVQAERLAEALAPVLAEAGERALLISSPMRRALQTALPLATRAGIDRARLVCHDELFEVGSRQESAEQLRARVDRIITWIEATLARDEHDVVIVVAHGELLTRWLRRWLGVPKGRGLAFVHANSGITSLGWNPRHGLLLDLLNDLSHLDSELRTGGDRGVWWGYTLPEIAIEHYDGWSKVPAEAAAELAELRRQLLEPEGKSLADYAAIDEGNAHIVARAEAALVGYVQYDRGQGRLRQLVVAPSHRRSGLGRRLVGEIEFAAMLEGREQLRVHAWVQSIEFYRAIGFVPQGPVEPGPGLPWQAMVKALPTTKK